LLDFEILSRPTQPVAQCAHRRHGRPPRASRRDLSATSTPAAAASSAAPAATPAAGRSGIPDCRTLGLGKQEAQRIIAFGLIEFPPSAQIHARWRGQCQLFAGARG
jgi:hypothetical protein